MKRKIIACLVLGTAIAFAGNGDIRAQELNELIENVGSDYGSMYTLPLTNSLGADLNAGLFHTAKSASGPIGLNVYVGVKFAGMLVSPADQVFDLRFPSEVTFDYTIGNDRFELTLPAEFSVADAPTIFGERTAAVGTARVQADTSLLYQGNLIPVSIDTTFTQELIGGLVKTNIAPLVIPHASVGSVMGTDVSIRLLPEISHPNYGRISLKGYGVRHQVSQYLSVLPVDVAVSLMWQKLSTGANAGGDLSIDISTMSYGVIVSKQLMLVTVYGGLQREKTQVDYAYTFNGLAGIETEPLDISFSHDASIRGRAVIGAALHLGPLVTNVDFAVGSERIASAGIGFGF